MVPEVPSGLFVMREFGTYPVVRIRQCVLVGGIFSILLVCSPDQANGSCQGDH